MDTLNILDQQGRRKKHIENVSQMLGGFLWCHWWQKSVGVNPESEESSRVCLLKRIYG